MTASIVSLLLATALAAAPAVPPVAVNNDNRIAAGRIEAATLNIRLVAGIGRWRPTGPDGQALDVAAFSEEGAAPSVPGPLIRVPAGTTIALSLRNDLASELRVGGLCARPATTCEAIAIPPGAARDVRFSLNAPGTFSYWGTTSSRTFTGRTRVDSQLNGAIVVDRAGAPATDRVMVLSSYQDGPPVGPCATNPPDAVYVINGASWPHTTRLAYAAGDTVRWRVLNLTCEQHALHLHGFHFTVLASGDGITDHAFSEDEERTEVTEAVMPGRTFSLAWTPSRAGHWLFHCHMVPHMAAMPTMHSDATAAGHVAGKPDAHALHTSGPDAFGMAGLVVGIDVAGPSTAPAADTALPVQRLSLILREEANRYGTAKGYRMDLEGTDAPRVDSGPVPGPILVAHRGETTEVTVVNRMSEPTAIHWHGMEIESYFDGVPGFGGTGSQVASPIAPGQSFVVRFTPPRVGTFMYHTHWHDEAQLAGGMYGALLVLEPGENYDPATDHLAIIGLNGAVTAGEREPFALNGRATPAPVVMRAGVRHRLRLINITSTNVGLTAFLTDQTGIKEWTPVSKDGAALPVSQRRPRPARQPIAVGETYDFEITPAAPQNLWLEVRRLSGEWVLQAPIQVR